MMQPGLYQILFISTALFFIGVYGFFTRRNLITMLMSIELILNSVNLNFIAFNKYLWPHKLDGLFFTIFIIAIAAAEAAVAIAKSDIDFAKASSELAVMAAQIAALRKYRQKK